MLTGLSSFSDYSIRVIFATSFPFKQAASKSAVYLWTPEKLTCCVFNDFVVTSQPFSKTISVKWKLPEHLSGRVRQIKLFLASYSFSDCASFIYLVNNKSAWQDPNSNAPRPELAAIKRVVIDSIQSQTAGSVFNSTDLFYDATNQVFD